MWIGTIAVIAFCVGFLLATLPACAKAADAEVEVMRRTASSQDDHRWEATGGAVGRRVMSPMGVARLPERNSDETGICAGCWQVLDDNRRVKAT